MLWASFVPSSAYSFLSRFAHSLWTVYGINGDWIKTYQREAPF